MFTEKTPQSQSEFAANLMKRQILTGLQAIEEIKEHGVTKKAIDLAITAQGPIPDSYRFHSLHGPDHRAIQDKVMTVDNWVSGAIVDARARDKKSITPPPLGTMTPRTFTENDIGVIFNGLTEMIQAKKATGDAPTLQARRMKQVIGGPEGLFRGQSFLQESVKAIKKP